MSCFYNKKGVTVNKIVVWLILYNLYNKSVDILYSNTEDNALDRIAINS